MLTQDRIIVGDVQFCMEDGGFRLYSNEEGELSCSLSAEEAQEVLDVLAHYRQDSDLDTTQQDSDYTEEDYTGGWLCVGR
jgi:inhibitor of KinA sporulation pathway (predicted exonuclease)